MTHDIAQVGKWVIAQHDDGSTHLYQIIDGNRYGGSAMSWADLEDIKQCVERALEVLQALERLEASRKVSPQSLVS